MKITDFIEDFATFISVQPCVNGFDEVHIIANPVAGGFTRRKIFNNVWNQLSKLKAESNSDSRKSKTFTHITRFQGDSGNIVRGIIADRGDERKILFVIVGGDGTATEAASEIYSYILKGGKGENLILFRLPMGTGNDGLDADNMETAFTISSRECTAKKIPLLEISFASGKLKYATNIASFGLDAYVTQKTNTMKKIIPGSFYSFMVDIAALFYESSVEMDPFAIRYTEPNGRMNSDTFTALLLAVGVSGNRTYGGGKWVLPGDENVCAVGRMKFLTKFTVKELLYQGKHTDLEMVQMYTAKEIQVSFSNSLLFQHDGEVIPLQKEDFPVTLKIIPDAIQVLRPVDSTILQNLRGIWE